jgi:hypothetical protein
MTVLNQNFSMFSGETKYIAVANTKDDGSDLDLAGASITWTVKKRENSPDNVLSKETPEITVSGNVLTIPLKPPDTEPLLGTFYHKCECVDQFGNESVLMTGMLTIKL